MKRAGVSREALLSVRLDYESIVESIEGPRAVRELIWPKDYGSTTFGPPRWPQSSQLDSSDTGVPAHMASFSLTDNEGLLHQERAQLAQSKSNAAKSQTAKPNPARNVNTNNPEERRTKSAGLMKTESTQTEFDPEEISSLFALGYIHVCCQASAVIREH
ncbi:hypothetical protein Pelo_12227 [Pelomyxa schiedti]|nr:hypothetical protein Pelo_12227 [Pelomyxa schiedti]